MTTLICATGLRDVPREKENTVACRHTAPFVVHTFVEEAHVLYVSPWDRKQIHFALYCRGAAAQCSESKNGVKVCKKFSAKRIMLCKSFFAVCVCAGIFISVADQTVITTQEWDHVGDYVNKSWWCDAYVI